MTEAEHPQRKPLTYREAGVDLDRYAEAIQRIGRLVRSTQTERVIPLEGGFAGLFRLESSRPLFARRYVRPVLVAAADGVGTKIKVAIQAGRHDTVGIDLVAMSVNDCLAVGAEPLFFLDYIALAEDDPELVAQIVAGIAEGCRRAGCALLGGETAVMPDMYPAGHYDLAGFCVAVAEEYKLVTGEAIRPGDVLVGLGSSGLHSNGFSLVRRVVFDVAKLSLDQNIPELERPLVDVLLEPTHIYVQPVLHVLQHYRVKRVIRGISHITGGGIPENVSRILPSDVDAVFQRGSWPEPPVFAWLQRVGPIETEEMFRVFNMGLGMVMVVRPYYAEAIVERLRQQGCSAWIVGRVEEGTGRVRIINA